MLGFVIGILLTFHLFTASSQLSVFKPEHELRRFDGWFNNPFTVNFGSIGEQLVRKVHPEYDDGAYIPRHGPSSRFISNHLFSGDCGIRNLRNITTFFAFFGHLVNHDVFRTGRNCPAEIIEIPVPRCDPLFDPHCQGEHTIPCPRAVYHQDTGTGVNNPRQPINLVTAWLDASFLYGCDEPTAQNMRAFAGGRLKEGNPGNPVQKSNGVFVFGDETLNENHGLLALGMVFFRYHNWLADEVARRYPEWKDEAIFTNARRLLIATYQKIVIYDFLPHFVGKGVGPYPGYDPTKSPQISAVFATGPLQYFETLFPAGMLLRIPGSCKFGSNISTHSTISMCNHWWTPHECGDHFTTEEVLLGLTSQIAERDDIVVVEDLRDHSLGSQYMSGMDEVAGNIMLSRDYGIPSYSLVRQAFGLPPPNTFASINPALFQTHPELLEELEETYANYNVTEVDFYVGGMLESEMERGMGPLFRLIALEQFQRLRVADRFWFENTQSGLFTSGELAEIRNVSMSEVLTRVGLARDDLGSIGRDVFVWKNGDPCPQPFQVSDDNVEHCLPNVLQDYFEGNGLPFVFTCIVLGIVPFRRLFRET